MTLLSLRELTADELDLIGYARDVIDANTDAEPDQDGVHTMGAAVRNGDGRVFTGVNLYHDYYPGIRVILPTAGGLRSVLIEDLVPLATAWSTKHGSEMV